MRHLTKSAVPTCSDVLRFELLPTRQSTLEAQCSKFRTGWTGGGAGVGCGTGTGLKLVECRHGVLPLGEVMDPGRGTRVARGGKHFMEGPREYLSTDLR